MNAERIRWPSKVADGNASRTGQREDLGPRAPRERRPVRRAILGMVTSLLCACGSGPGAPLNSALAGTWTGPVTVNYFGNAASYTGHIVVAVSGNAASVAGVCPYGSGTLTATGSGNSATWSGELVCPAFGFPGEVVPLLSSPTRA